MQSTKLRIGISACLLGEQVRFDGGHKRDPFLTDTLSTCVEWVPVCPEVETGMGIPREPIHLLESRGQLRLVGVRSDRDHTETMRRYAESRLDQLALEDLSGYVLKKDSPSCGLARVRVHHGNGQVTRTGQGLFAAALTARFPTLPIEEEGRLNDPRLRDNWLDRVFAYHRLQTLWKTPWKLGDLVSFHTSHKLLVLAHSPAGYTALGRLVAASKGLTRQALRDQYEQAFMQALAKIATPGRHSNVMQHMLGYFSEEVDIASRDEVLRAIEDYRLGYAPLAAPLTLIAHHARRLGITYLTEQVYLAPRPKELQGSR